MNYFNLHTHKLSFHPETISIVSVDIREPVDCKSKNNLLFSIGIHPWHVNEKERIATNLLFAKVRQLALLPEVVAIGETGLDKNTAKSANDFAFQQELFFLHVRLSEELKKPLIVHCVKAWEALFHIHQVVNPSMPWMIHGFRGKLQLAVSLLSAGFFLSFGKFYHKDALKAAWIKRRLFLETDDKEVDIRNIYQQVACDLNITVEDLSKEIENVFLNFT